MSDVEHLFLCLLAISITPISIYTYPNELYGTLNSNISYLTLGTGYIPGTFIILFTLHRQIRSWKQSLYPPHSKETSPQRSDLLKVIELDSGRDQTWTHISLTWGTLQLAIRLLLYSWVLPFLQRVNSHGRMSRKKTIRRMQASIPREAHMWGMGNGQDTGQLEWNQAEVQLLLPAHVWWGGDGVIIHTSKMSPASRDGDTKLIPSPFSLTLDSQS